METDNPFVLLKALKGAPLSVLIALRLILRPASETDLARATDYNRETVAIALGRLEQLGLVDRAHMRGWQLTAPAYQLPLFTPGELEGGEAVESFAAPEPVLLLPSEDGPRGDAGLSVGKSSTTLVHTQDFDAQAPSVGKSSSQVVAEDGVGSSVGISSTQDFDVQSPSVGESSSRILAEDGAEGSVGISSTQDPDAEAPSVGISSTQVFAPDAAALSVGKSSTQDRGAALSVGKSSTGEAGLARVDGRRRGGLINPSPEDHKPRPPLASARERPSAGKSSSQTDDDGPDAPSVGKSSTGAVHSQPPDGDLDRDERTLVEDLVSLTGCTRTRAETAVRAARTHGQPPAYLQLQVLYWHNYIASRRGETLRNPGYFVAAKLEAGEPCPLRNVSPEHNERAWALHVRLEVRHEDEEEEDVGPDLAEPDEPEPAAPAPPQRTDAERCADIREHLALSLPEAAVTTWFNDSDFALHDRTLLVYAASPQARDVLDERFRPAIRRVAAIALGMPPQDLQVQILAQPLLTQEAAHAQASV